MKKKSLSILISLALIASTSLPTVAFADTTPVVTTAPASTYGIEYQGHVQNIGWQSPVTTIGDSTDIVNAAEAGTNGRSLRVEAIKITGTNLPQGASITYQGHVQNIGWQNPITVTGNQDINSVKEAGTDGQSLRIEAFKMTLNGMPGYAIKYQAHVQNIGWQEARITENGASISNAAEAGTHGQSLRMEALRIQIVKTDTEKAAEIKAINSVNKAAASKSAEDVAAAKTDVQAVQDTAEASKLTTEVQGIQVDNTPVSVTSVSLNKTTDTLTVGDTDTLVATIAPTNATNKNITWSSSNTAAATVDASGKVTAVGSGESVITATPADGIKPASCTVTVTNPSAGVTYDAHVQNIGWQSPWVNDGGEAGTDGKSLRVEALKINLTHAPSGASISYSAHVQNIGWQGYKSNGDIAGTTGQGLRVEALKIKLENMPNYSVAYRAHVQNVGWQNWVYDDQIAGTTGQGLRVEALEIKIIPKQTINVSSVSLNKNSDALTVGDTDTLVATIAPTNATNKNVTWSSSNSAVASVDSNGKVTAVSSGNSGNTAVITATTADGNKTASCTVTVNNKKAYVTNTSVTTDLNVRSAPTLGNNIIGSLYTYQQLEVLDTVNDTQDGIVWYKINYNGSTAYVANSYMKLYNTPPSDVVNIARNITKQYEVGTANQISGNFDGQGLSLGYLQWCIGQGTLQPLLNRMDRQFNSIIKNIFGTNYDSLHGMIADTLANQLTWAKNINNSSNTISDPWNSQFVNLTKNDSYVGIEDDATVYMVNQAMNICNKYNLKTVRGFALAFDIIVQNGSISQTASNTISAALAQYPNMSEKQLLTFIANAVSDASGSADVRSRKVTIVAGQGEVHGEKLDLDKNYGLNDTAWR